MKEEVTEPQNIFFFSNGEKFSRIVLVKEPEDIRFIINHKLEFCYAHQDFIDIDKRFRSFASICEIYSFLISILKNKQIVSVDKSNLAFDWNGRKTVIPLKDKHSKRIIGLELLLDLQERILSIQRLNSSLELKLKYIETIKEEKSLVLCLCSLNEEKFASCNAKGEIKIWKTSNCEIQATFKSDYNVKYISTLSDKLLLSGGGDLRSGVINIWDIDNKKCLSTLVPYHGSIVNKVRKISDERICSCSDDKTLMIFDSFEPYQHKFTIRGHDSMVWSFIELNNGSHIISLSSSGQLRIWNDKSYKCEKTIENLVCNDGHQTLLDLDDEVIVGTLFGLTILDAKEMRIKKAVTLSAEPNLMITSMIKYKDNIILLGDEEGMLYGVNVKNSNCFKVALHRSRIHHLFNLGKKKFLSCSKEEMRRWKLVTENMGLLDIY